MIDAVNNYASFFIMLNIQSFHSVFEFINKVILGGSW